MFMKKVILAAAVILSGCAIGTNTVEDLAKSPYKDEFEVADGYQQTYRQIIAGIEKCEGLTPSYFNPVRVDTELFTDIKEGRIVLYAEPSVGAAKPFRYIKIDNVGKDKSQVTVYHFMQSTVDKTRNNYRRWANGDLTCE